MFLIDVIFPNLSIVCKITLQCSYQHHHIQLTTQYICWLKIASCWDYCTKQMSFQMQIFFFNILLWNGPLWSTEFDTGLAPSHPFDWEPKKKGLIYPHIEDGPEHAPERHPLIRNGFEWFLKLLIGLEMAFDGRRKKTEMNSRDYCL